MHKTTQKIKPFKHPFSYPSVFLFLLGTDPIPPAFLKLLVLKRLTW